MNAFHNVVRAIVATLSAVAFAGSAQALVVAAELPAFAGTTTVTFDEPVAGWALKTQYTSLGIADFDALVLGERGSAFSMSHALFGLPGTVSGDNIGLNGATIEFAAGVDRVGVWLYKANGAQYLTALDAAQNVLLTLAADAGSADSSFYDFVGMQSDTKNIRYVVISNKNLAADTAWSITGYSAFYDNLMFSPIAAVPEPETWVLMLVCLALMGVVVRRKP